MKKLLLLVVLFLSCSSDNEQMPICPCSVESIETIRIMNGELGTHKTYSIYYKIGIKKDNTYGLMRTRTKYAIGDTIL